MPSLIDLIQSQLGNREIEALGQAAGTDTNQTKSALSAAIPALLGALSKSAEKPAGAEGLQRALEKDHDGSILNQLPDLFQGRVQNRAANGDGILGHLLGGRKDTIQAGLGQAAGVKSDSMGKIMAMLAPVVMGSLGKQQKSSEGGLGAAALSAMLRNERKEAERREPKSSSLLGKMFDQDGDGDLDLGDLTAGLGKLF